MSEAEVELIEIGAVARELGVPASTLQAWERRYRLVVPHRGPRGLKLYDAGQVAMLRCVVEEVALGTSPPEAHRRIAAAPPRRVLRVRLAPRVSAPADARWALAGLLDGEAAGSRFAFDLRLVASELVTAMVLYGAGGSAVELEVRLFLDRAELEVHSAGSSLSLDALHARRRADGRELELVGALAEAWSLERSPAGVALTARVRRRG